MIIKVRAWLPKQKMFVYWGVYNDPDDGSYQSGPPAVREAIHSFFTGLYSADDRKEIYGGDKVRMHQFNHEGGDITPSTEGVIEYDSDSACFGLRITKPGANRELEIGNFMPICNFYGLHEESWTILGNIYEVAE